MTTRPNPYVGPRSFETGEKLYGRDKELRSLTALLVAERIVLMHSPSGAGKTSLLKAGLLPSLREEEFNVLPVVRVNIDPPEEVTGANRYVLSTLLSLEEGMPAEERLPLAELASLSLDEYLSKHRADKDTVLVLDQFEEVLTIASTDRDGKLAFFEQLGEALRAKNLWTLISMREDYLGMLAPYVRPIPNRLVTRFRLDLLGVEAAIQAMQLPAKAAGVDFQITAANKLADDLRRILVQLPDGSMEPQSGLYVEPVQLQVVCYRIWEGLDEVENVIDEEDLTRIGNVDQALADYYAQIVTKVADETDVPERTVRDWFEHKLITPEGLRGQVRLGVDVSEGLPNPAVRQLENAHIIRADQRAGQTWVELAHDRLLEPVRSSNREWFNKNLSVFQRQAEVWIQKDRSEGLLLRGHDLDQAETEISGMKLRPEELEFLDACRLLRRRAKREKILRRGIAIGLVASLILGVVAVYFAYRATQANASFDRAAKTAQAASTEAIVQQNYAQVASTEAIKQQSIAQAASTQAIQQKALAEDASKLAIANANAAATARVQAEREKANALEQERIAELEKKQAEASALVAQSLLLQLKAREDLANLLAVEAFRIADTSRTRTQLLTPVYNRGQLTLAQNNNSGLIPSMFYTPDNNGIVSTDFFTCKQDNFYACDASIVKFWAISRDARRGDLPNGIGQGSTSVNPPGLADAVALSPDGTTLAVSSCDPLNTNTLKCEAENVTFWNLSTRKPAGQTINFKGDLVNDKAVLLAYSPDGKTLALGLNIPTVFNSSPTSKPIVILWNLADSKQIMQFTPEKGIYQMAFSMNSKTLAIAGGDTVTLLDIASQQFSALAPTTSPRKVYSLAYSPDGKFLAVGMEDGSIRLIDLAGNQAIDPVMNNIARPLTLAFSPDGKILAAGYQDAGLILWDTSSRQRLNSSPIYKHVEVPDKYPILSLAFSPDGKQLATASNEIILWDTDPDSWSVKACNIAGHNFSKSDWLQYFPGQPYQITCPQFPAGRNGT
ncbi:MAG TPA: hypothetical protein VGK00_06710 [Anaerolineales bacterium]|jgi:WD40 repeat protein